MPQNLVAKITLLLETLAEQPLWRLKELSEHTNIPAATCARLLAQLQEEGWVDQVSARGAYRLGARIPLLAERQPYVGGLIECTRPLVDSLFQRLNQPVVVARLRGSLRQVLLLRTPEEMTVNGHPREDDAIYIHATGRLLLAHLDSKNRQRLVDELGLPTPDTWPGILSSAELESECRELRQKGWANKEDEDWDALAVIIKHPVDGYACLGTYARPGLLHEESLAQLQKAQLGFNQRHLKN